MNTWSVVTIVITITLVINSSSVYAHHAFAAEFDADAPVLLKGKVVKKELINPHSWIHVDVVKEDGSVEHWMVEGGTPNTLLRNGITKKSPKQKNIGGRLLKILNY